MDKPIHIGLVDDHKMFRKGMVELINAFDDFTVTLEANNGKELTQRLEVEPTPAIIILDINMKEMDGYDTALWLQQHYPEVKVLALSMYDHETAIIKMLKNGARGYILKDAEPEELKRALEEIRDKGFFYSATVGQMLLKTMQGEEMISINDKELEFLKLSCTEMTYKEIADQMCVSPRTVDGYREALFEKLSVKNRVGLVMYAIRNGIVKV